MDGEDIVHSITVVVLGDTNGDGEIGAIDYQRIRAAFLGTYKGLTDAYLKAALVSGNSDIEAIDYQRVRAHFLGNYELYA